LPEAPAAGAPPPSAVLQLAAWEKSLELELAPDQVYVGVAWAAETKPPEAKPTRSSPALSLCAARSMLVTRFLHNIADFDNASVDPRVRRKS
jgi:hypothetical protein